MIEDVQPYHTLCNKAQIEVWQQPIELQMFSQPDGLADASKAERLTASLQVLLEMMADEKNDDLQIDRVLLDRYILAIDDCLAKNLDTILHDPQFQQLESLWQSVHYLVSNSVDQSNCKIECLCVNKDELRDDFLAADDLTQSGLYKHLYIDEYDTPGGEPIAAIITPFEFDASSQDIDLLKELAKIAAVSHCPLIGNIGPKFFFKEQWTDVLQIEDLENYLERAEYIRWNAFRDSEDARYIGLATPKFLLRLPYGVDNTVRGFVYTEDVSREEKDYLWACSSFAFATRLINSFCDYGWCVNIRGPQSGGKVDCLPLHYFDLGNGWQCKMPTEVLISETRELTLAQLGFIPLSYYKNTDYACFFSANSAQSPAIYQTAEATANSRINSRLPYVFLSSRLAHYLKVLQREQIGANKNATELADELNDWLKTLVTTMNNPNAELAAMHPLRDGYVEVTAQTDNPGMYKVELFARPHFQVEGMNVRLSLVAQMPGLGIRD